MYIVQNPANHTRRCYADVPNERASDSRPHGRPPHGRMHRPSRACCSLRTTHVFWGQGVPPTPLQPQQGCTHYREGGRAGARFVLSERNRNRTRGSRLDTYAGRRAQRTLSKRRHHEEVRDRLERAVDTKQPQASWRHLGHHRVPLQPQQAGQYPAQPRRLVMRKYVILVVVCLVAGCATKQPVIYCGADHTPRDAQMGKCERLVVVPAL